MANYSEITIRPELPGNISAVCNYMIALLAVVIVYPALQVHSRTTCKAQTECNSDLIEP